jgi:hypothetical protein
MQVNLNDGIKKSYFGEIELIYKNVKTGKITVHREPNIVKIFAKEIISHRIPHHEVWDPEAGTLGEWVQDTDPISDFSVKYILLGASFDENGVPLDNQDDRFYVPDPVTGVRVPIRLTPGATNDGGLINAVPISEPSRPLKKIERVSYEPTYQPSSTPLLQDDVRAMNNILVVETTLKPDEYNGFGLTNSDFFTITEVALSAGRKLDIVSECDKTPRELFLEGPYSAEATGGDVVTLDDLTGGANNIVAGDQIRIQPAGTGGAEQVSEFYLVLDKVGTGKDLQLDRTPVDTDGNPITGDIVVYRDTLRIFSHRILSAPAKKTSEFEIIIRWRIFVS